MPARKPNNSFAIPSNKTAVVTDAAEAFIGAADSHSVPSSLSVQRPSAVRELAAPEEEEERPTHGLTIRFTRPELDAIGRIGKRQQRSKHFVARGYIIDALALDASDRERKLNLIQLRHPDKSKSELIDEAIDILFERYGRG